MLKVSRDMDVNDKTNTLHPQGQNKHSKLWEAVEVNDIKVVKQYLETYEEKHNEELKEPELYD